MRRYGIKVRLNLFSQIIKKKETLKVRSLKLKHDDVGLYLSLGISLGSWKVNRLYGVLSSLQFTASRNLKLKKKSAFALTAIDFLPEENHDRRLLHPRTVKEKVYLLLSIPLGERLVGGEIVSRLRLDCEMMRLRTTFPDIASHQAPWIPY